MSYLVRDLHISHTNLDVHLAGLRHEWCCRFLPTWVFDDPAIAAARKSYRTDPTCQPQTTGQRAPLTWEMLESIVTSAASIPGSPDHMTATACLLAFCGLFRVSEVAFTTATNPHCLTAGCVEFRVQNTPLTPPILVPSYLIAPYSFHQVLAVRITQHSAKNRSIHEPPATMWFSTDPTRANDPLDLPFALFHWATSSNASLPDSPFFSTSSPYLRPLTSRMLTSTIRACAVRFGLNPALYGTHSLKVGGSSHLRALGVPADVIQRAGRWKSMPVSLRYPAQSSIEQDNLMRTFRLPSQFHTDDVRMSRNLPRRPTPCPTPSSATHHTTPSRIRPDAP